jgi:hypothetical protein
MYPTYPAYVTRPGRPVGIVVLTILQVLTGIAEIAGGLLLILAYFVVTAILGGGLLAIGVLALGIVAFVIGVFSFILAYGLWAGKGWAWVLSIAGAVIGLVFGVLSIVAAFLYGGFTLDILGYLVPVVLYVIILVYLSTRNVRAFFGRGGGIAYARAAVPPPMAQPYMQQPSYVQPPAQQPYYQQTVPQPSSWGTIACPYCGAPNSAGAGFCDRCGNRLR